MINNFLIYFIQNIVNIFCVCFVLKLNGRKKHFFWNAFAVLKIKKIRIALTDKWQLSLRRILFFFILSIKLCIICVHKITNCQRYCFTDFLCNSLVLKQKFWYRGVFFLFSFFFFSFRQLDKKDLFKFYY